MITRITVALLLLGACAAHQPVDRPSRTVIAGRVLDEQGRPIRGAQVYIETKPIIGSLTDSLGRFAIAGVPPGTDRVLAQLIGYRLRVEPIQIQPGDSLELLFRMADALGGIAGSDVPLPQPNELRVAVDLIPRVLQDTAVSALLEKHRIFSHEPALPVLVHWLTTEDTIVLPGNPELRVARQCRECVTRTFYNLEGGSMYTAGIRHINLGVRSYGPDELHFCVNFYDPGEAAMRNCGASFKSASVVYQRTSGGSWIRTRYP